MAMYGMDIEQVRQLATLFGQKADDIQQIIQTVSSRLSSTNWVGPDADQFENDWNSTLVPDLRRVEQSLRDAQQKANKNASDQSSTSASL